MREGKAAPGKAAKDGKGQREGDPPQDYDSQPPDDGGKPGLTVEDAVEVEELGEGAGAPWLSQRAAGTINAFGARVASPGFMTTTCVRSTAPRIASARSWL